MNNKEEEIWLHTRSPRRIPGLTVVVVVTFFVKILDDFHDFLPLCLFSEENQQPVLGGHRFSEGK